jgi:hypothetical protein
MTTEPGGRRIIVEHHPNGQVTIATFPFGGPHITLAKSEWEALTAPVAAKAAAAERERWAAAKAVGDRMAEHISSAWTPGIPEHNDADEWKRLTDPAPVPGEEPGTGL